MKQKTFDLTESQLARLAIEAHRSGQGQAELVRSGLEMLFASRQTPYPTSTATSLPTSQAVGTSTATSGLVPSPALPTAGHQPGHQPGSAFSRARTSADKSYSLDRGDGLPEEKEKQESPPTVSTAPEPPEPPEPPEEAGDLDPLEFWQPREPPAPLPPVVSTTLAADQPVLPELAGALPPPPEAPDAARPRRKRSKPAEDPDADPMARHPEGVRRVFSTWKRSLELIGETPPKVIAKEDAIVINSRLAEGIPVKNLQQAVDGWTLDPWPERRSPTAHLIRQLLKNRETVEKFRKFQLDFEAQDAREYEDQKRYWDLLEKAGIAEAMRRKNYEESREFYPDLPPWRGEPAQ